MPDERDADQHERRRLRADQRRRRRRTVWVAVAAVLAVVLVAGGAVTALVLTNQVAPEAAPDPVATEDAEPIAFPDDEPAATPGSDPCIAVPVLSSLENSEMVAKLVEGYNAQPRDVDGSCVTLTATKEKSGLVAEEAAASFKDVPEDKRPIIWMPDSSSWLSVARHAGGGASVPKEGPSVAESDIVLAMPEALADAIGWDREPPSWEEIFAATGDAETWSDLGHPEWGEFKLGKTSPLIATSGEAALLASYGSVAGSLGELTADEIEDAAITAEVEQHELATSHYMATPEHFLWHARQSEDKGSVADFLSAVIVDEKSVYDYNRGITSRDGVTRIESSPPEEQLVPIYPSDGYFEADNPAAVLMGRWVDETEAAAAADFVRYTATAQGQQIVRDAGYRDLNGELSPLVEEVGRLAAASEGGLPLPEERVIVAVQDAFPEVRKRAQVLFLVDVSGSMSDPIATGKTKLAAAKEAITLALEHFTPGDHVGLAGFSSVDDGPITPGLVSPVADIDTTRAAFLKALGALKPVEFTPLYAAVDMFARQQSAEWEPDRINAIVLLSDGRNETLGPTIDAAGMLAGLGELHHHNPVLVFTLAYGADADVATLQSISSATGAHYYDATDPTKLDAVLGDLVTSF